MNNDSAKLLLVLFMSISSSFVGLYNLQQYLSLTTDVVEEAYYQISRI